MDFEDLSGEISDGNDEHVTGNRKKGDLCYIMAKNFT